MLPHSSQRWNQDWSELPIVSDPSVPHTDVGHDGRDVLSIVLNDIQVLPGGCNVELMHGDQRIPERVQEVQCCRPPKVGVDIHPGLLWSNLRCGVGMLLYMDSREASGVRAFTVMVFGVVSVGLSVDCTWLRPSLVCSLPSTIRSALHILILPRLCIIIIFTIYVAAGIRILKKRKELRVFSNPPIEAELVGNLSSRSETTEGNITTERNRHGRTMSNVSHVHVRRINGELLTPSDGASL